MKPKTTATGRDKIWRSVYELAQQVYDIVDAIIVAHPEEAWATASKMRNAANDSLYYASQAAGVTKPVLGLHDWYAARKNLFALKSMYTFAGRRRMIVLDPDIVVTIDDLLREIDAVTDALEAEQLTSH